MIFVNKGTMKKASRSRPIIITGLIVLGLWTIFGIVPLAMADDGSDDPNDGFCCFMFIIGMVMAVIQIIFGAVYCVLAMMGIVVLVIIVYGSVKLIRWATKYSDS